MSSSSRLFLIENTIPLVVTEEEKPAFGGDRILSGNSKSPTGPFVCGFEAGVKVLLFFVWSGPWRAKRSAQVFCFMHIWSKKLRWVRVRVRSLVGAGWAEVVGFCWDLGKVGWRSFLGRGVAFQLVLFQF